MNDLKRDVTHTDQTRRKQKTHTFNFNICNCNVKSIVIKITLLVAHCSLHGGNVVVVHILAAYGFNVNQMRINVSQIMREKRKFK